MLCSITGPGLMHIQKHPIYCATWTKVKSLLATQSRPLLLEYFTLSIPYHQLPHRREGESLLTTQSRPLLSKYFILSIPYHQLPCGRGAEATSAKPLLLQEPETALYPGITSKKRLLLLEFTWAALNEQGSGKCTRMSFPGRLHTPYTLSTCVGLYSTLNNT